MRQTESDVVPSTANPASAVAILDVLRREHWPEVARIYVDASARGHGLGRLLLEALITSTEAARIWTIQTGIFPENEASVSLHQRVGFEIVGTRKRLGKLNGVWRDVLLLERRSAIVD